MNISKKKDLIFVALFLIASISVIASPFDLTDRAAIATAVYTALLGIVAYVQLSATRKANEEAVAPDVSLSLEMMDKYSGNSGILIVLRNYGKTPAMNIVVKSINGILPVTDDEIRDFVKKGYDVNKTRIFKGIKHLSPSESYAAYWLKMWNPSIKTSDGCSFDESYSFEIHFEDRNGQKRKNAVTLSLRDHYGTIIPKDRADKHIKELVSSIRNSSQLIRDEMKHHRPDTVTRISIKDTILNRHQPRQMKEMNMFCARHLSLEEDDKILKSMEHRIVKKMILYKSLLENAGVVFKEVRRK